MRNPHYDSPSGEGSVSPPKPIIVGGDSFHLLTSTEDNHCDVCSGFINWDLVDGEPVPFDDVGRSKRHVCSGTKSFRMHLKNSLLVEKEYPIGLTVTANIIRSTLLLPFRSPFRIQLKLTRLVKVSEEVWGFAGFIREVKVYGYLLSEKDPLGYMVGEISFR
jgi:hypothetical protein